MTKQSKIFLVGGAVRDAVLGLPCNDLDYCVVGSNVGAMLAAGFEQVGNDFPVFLHPDTKDEYALARSERSTGAGFQDFSFDTENVSIEDDLSRRDLTINSLAQDVETGAIIDPFGGLNDLKNGIIRHTTAAFAEDPTRILRACRFAARFGFSIAPETMDLMSSMVACGMLDNTTPERIWKEITKALASDKPSIFFVAMMECGALDKVLPELAALHNVPQNAKFHAEGCAFTHTMMVVDAAAKLSDSLEVRFAALCHDLGKGVTPTEILPAHIGHEKAGLPLVNKVCDRLRVPNTFRKLAVKVTPLHMKFHLFGKMKASKRVDFLTAVGLQHFDFFMDFLTVCRADGLGKLPVQDTDLVPFIEQWKAVKNTPCPQGFKGKEIANQLRIARIDAIR